MHRRSWVGAVVLIGYARAHRRDRHLITRKRDIS